MGEDFSKSDVLRLSTIFLLPEWQAYPACKLCTHGMSLVARCDVQERLGTDPEAVATAIKSQDVPMGTPLQKICGQFIRIGQVR